MPARDPSFSPFPFERLPRVRRRDAAVESALARWIAPRRLGAKLGALVGGAVRVRFLGTVVGGDPHAAVAGVRLTGASDTIALTASARPVRALAQRLLGGPLELDAPRPLTVAEHAIWALAIAAAIADLGIAAEVWPLEGEGIVGGTSPGAAAVSRAGAEPRAAAVSLDPAQLGAGKASGVGDASPRADRVVVAWDVALPASFAGAALQVTAYVPAALALRVPPARPPHAWRFDLPIVVGRCVLPRASVAALAARDVVTLEPHLALVIGAGEIGLAAPPGAVEARVATEYVARDMALVDDAHLEVTVQLGAARLSLRELGELAIGQVVALGRPLAGPYEVRAAGRVVGQGELVDIDGELGVRIVSIADQPDQE